MEKEVENIIQDILLHELNLPTNYGKDSKGFIVPSVYIVAPNISLGTTDKLQIGVQSIATIPIANHNRVKYVDSSTGGDPVATEYKEATINEMIQIDLSSRNNDARLRRHEAYMALNSIYSMQQQEKYGFRIFNLPSGFNNTSAADGGTTIYRYTLTMMVQYTRVYTSVIDYYDTFPASVNINEGQSEFTFTITANTLIYPST